MSKARSPSLDGISDAGIVCRNRQENGLPTVPLKERMRHFFQITSSGRLCLPMATSLTRFRDPQEKALGNKKETKTVAALGQREEEFGAQSSYFYLLRDWQQAGISSRRNLPSPGARRSYGSDKCRAPPLPHLPTHPQEPPVIGHLRHHQPKIEASWEP